MMGGVVRLVEGPRIAGLVHPVAHRQRTCSFATGGLLRQLTAGIKQQDRGAGYFPRRPRLSPAFGGLLPSQMRKKFLAKSWSLMVPFVDPFTFTVRPLSGT